MNSCVFCNILNQRNNNCKSKEDSILYEDDLLAIIPAKGTPIPGWILLIIKKHINGFAELTSNELLHVETIINRVKNIYEEHFKIKSILLEHGSTSHGRHPQSIVHAHIHLIPFNFDTNIEYELINQLQLKSINSIQEIATNKNLDYWLYCNPEGKFYTSAEIQDVPRSIFMNLVAKQKGIELPYEWRKVITNEKILNEMITIFKNNMDKLKNKYNEGN